MKLVIGLGNPGQQYERTRHNAGFAVADRMAEKLGVLFSRSMNEALVARAYHAGLSVLLVKPQTFMNLSGRAVAPIARRYGCAPEDILVFADDRHLPLGMVRLRPGGGAGGHKGLLSIAAEMGSADFHRARLGIGSDTMPKGNLTAFVLGRFAEEESEAVAAMTERAVAAGLCWLEQGIEQAMSQFNARNREKGT